MAITQTISRYNIIDIAKQYKRLDNFGYDGWQKLFDYMEELSESCGEDIELDIVAWCCDYAMFNSAQEVFDNYDTLITQEEWDEKDDDEKLEAIEEFLQDNTAVVCCEDDCIIFQAF